MNNRTSIVNIRENARRLVEITETLLNPDLGDDLTEYNPSVLATAANSVRNARKLIEDETVLA